MAQAVAQRDEPAERADVGRGERRSRVGGPDLRRRKVEHEVVRADGEDRAVDLADAAQEGDVDILARVVTLEPGGHDEQPVGADERRQDPGAARQRRGDEVAADPSDAHADPVVHAHRRRELARDACAGSRRLGRDRSLERGQQRRSEDVERQRRGHRVAGSAEDGSPVDGAQHDGVPGPHRDAMDGQRPEPLDDARRVVVAPRAGAGDDDDEVRARGRVAHRVADHARGRRAGCRCATPRTRPPPPGRRA